MILLHIDEGRFILYLTNMFGGERMEFRQIEYILTLAETRNMTRAAEKLFISQPALSHYLKCVEEELGTRLFDRSTTPMTLTYAGKC